MIIAQLAPLLVSTLVPTADAFEAPPLEPDLPALSATLQSSERTFEFESEFEFDRTELSNRWYVEGGIAWASTDSTDGPSEQIDIDEGIAIPIAFGRRFDPDGDGTALEAEVEAYWSDQDIGQDQVLRGLSVFALLANLAVDIPLAERYSFYIGGGVGAGWVDTDETDQLDAFDDDDGPFLTWQVITGLRWFPRDRVVLDFGYRYVNVEDVEFEDQSGGLNDASFDLQTQQHVLGITARLWL